VDQLQMRSSDFWM